MPLKDRAPGVEDRVGPEEIVFQQGALRIGQFRCSRLHPSFLDSGPTSGWLLTFPRLPVLVAHVGEGRRDETRPVVVDPSIVKFFNRGQEFRREALSEHGDRCEWFSFEVATVSAAVRPFDPASADRPGRPFAWTHAPVDSASFLLQRRLADAVLGDAAANPRDILPIEEGMFALLARTIAFAYAKRGRPARKEDAANLRVQAAVVDHVERVLATRYRERLALTDLAKTVGYSPFHLARVFRARTGMTIHAKRQRIRLHVALEEVRDPRRDLMDIALGLGFASHSHFTEAFRRAFGRAPRRPLELPR